MKKKDPKKYLEKGVEDAFHYDKKELNKEYERFIKGLEILDKEGKSFSELRPYVQGLILGIERKYLESKDPKEAVKAYNIGFLRIKASLPAKKEIKTIETKVAASFFGLSVVAGILFGVNSMTGAAIGFANAPSGFLGAVLFIGGIAGLFFYKEEIIF